MTDITELTSVQKNANIHRLSRLIAYAPNDELRQLAVEVEQYTDQIIEALEKARETIAFQQGEIKALLSSMESHTVTVKLPKRTVGEAMHMSGFSRDYAEGWCAGNDNAIHQICNTSGIKWEAE
ncbi:hypothetical protein [Klebsiella michiganensis]|uniref:hypothetical protein n=1 Tax=Klebsiella michiganensis TaxID=1134687 RepID=UPI0016253111|nr:hypothetical protein [Klebsiella michiganensis]QNE52746.1 hypothetical protein H5403_07630 [Klebsiella michiganensis]